MIYGWIYLGFIATIWKFYGMLNKEILDNLRSLAWNIEDRGTWGKRSLCEDADVITFGNTYIQGQMVIIMEPYYHIIFTNVIPIWNFITRNNTT